MPKSLISLGGGWASLTGSGMVIRAKTYINAHINLCIFDPAKTPPQTSRERGR